MSINKDVNSDRSSVKIIKEVLNKITHFPFLLEGRLFRNGNKRIYCTECFVTAIQVVLYG